MKVLITGGTGFVGRSISRGLSEAGVPHRLLSRRGIGLGGLSEGFAGSILDRSSLDRALVGCDRVIHLVGIISEAPGQTYEGVHTEGTRHVLDAARAAAVRRWVHMSALGTRPDAVARYHRSKWEAEQAVRSSGLDWTVFRPSVIYGKGDGFVNLFAGIGRWSPLVPVVGGGHSRLQPVDVESVARCFVRAAVESLGIGETFDVCGPVPLTLREILDEIDRAMGRRRLRLVVPRPVAWGQARFLEWLFPSVFRQAPPLNRDQILMLDEDNVGDPLPARRLFGLPEESFANGLARMFGGSGIKRSS
jgi:NADH dehydrogenase